MLEENKKWYNQIVKKLLLSIIILIIGIILGFYIQNHLQRAKIEVDLESILLSYESPDSNIIAIDFYIYNMGKSAIMIDQIELDLFLDKLDPRPFVILFDYNEKLYADTIKHEVLQTKSSALSHYSDKLDTVQNLFFSRAIIKIYGLNSKLKFTKSYNNNDISYFIEYAIPEEKIGSIPVYIKNNILFYKNDPLEKYIIEFEGRKYTNYYYPKEVKLRHMISDNGRIEVDYGMESSFMMVGKGVFYDTIDFSDFFFASHPEIEHLIDLGDKLRFNATLIKWSRNNISASLLEAKIPPTRNAVMIFFK